MINKLCNPIINASSDINLLIKSASNRAEEISAEVEFQEELEINANTGEIIDIDPVADQSAETGPEQRGPGF